MTWEWSDLRYFLAVARAGTTLGAAKALGVNQTTCARRIAALEQALGVRLFDRAATGYPLTALGGSLISHAEKAEAAALAFARGAGDDARAAKRVIRFSASDILAVLIGEPAIDALARTRPDIRVELNVDSRAVDLVAGEADVALRADFAVEEPGLIVRKVLSTPWAIYHSRGYGGARRAPTCLAELANHPIATLAGRPAQVLQTLCPGADIRFSTNSMIALADAIARGECVGAMPMLVGTSRSDLCRCLSLDVETGVWIVYPERLRGQPHVRAFVDHLVGCCVSYASPGLAVMDATEGQTQP